METTVAPEPPAGPSPAAFAAVDRRLAGIEPAELGKVVALTAAGIGRPLNDADPPPFAAIGRPENMGLGGSATAPPMPSGDGLNGFTPALPRGRQA